MNSTPGLLNAFKLPSALMGKLNIQEGIAALDDWALTCILSFTANCLYELELLRNPVKIANIKVSGTFYPLTLVFRLNRQMGNAPGKVTFYFERIELIMN